MKIINFNTHKSILNQFLSELRDVDIQKDSMRFRRNIERIGEIMAYEISKELLYGPKAIKTPLSTAIENVPAEQPVIATILRAGIPLHQGFLNYFDHAQNAFVSAYRKYTDEEHFDIHIEYIASPRLDGKTLILTDTSLPRGHQWSMLTRPADQRTACPHPYRICHSQPAGRRAYPESVSGRQDHTVVRHHRP